MFSPVLSAAKVVMPTSTPTRCPVPGKTCRRTSSQTIDAYQCPSPSSLTRTCLSLPSSGRCSLILTFPTPDSDRRLPPPTSQRFLLVQSLNVNDRYLPLPLKR